MEELRSERPVEAPAISRPVEIEARIPRDARDRVRTCIRSDHDWLSSERQGREMYVEPLTDRDVPLVRRGDDRDRIRRGDVHSPVTPIEIDAEERTIPTLAAHEENPISSAVVLW